jgi:hypothetical protein
MTKNQKAILEAMKTSTLIQSRRAWDNETYCLVNADQQKTKVAAQTIWALQKVRAIKLAHQETLENRFEIA